MASGGRHHRQCQCLPLEMLSSRHTSRYILGTITLVSVATNMKSLSTCAACTAVSFSFFALSKTMALHFSQSNIMHQLDPLETRIRCLIKGDEILRPAHLQRINCRARTLPADVSCPLLATQSGVHIRIASLFFVFALIVLVRKTCLSYTVLLRRKVTLLFFSALL